MQNSKLYGVSNSSLNDRIHEKRSPFSGAPTKLSRTTELLIAKHLIFMCQIGFGLRKQDILVVIDNNLICSKQIHLYTNAQTHDDCLHRLRTIRMGFKS